MMSVKLPSRFNFPKAEKKYEWLPMLLDAYHIIDSAIKIELEQEENKRNQKCACKKGCAICCQKPTVPITDIELTGISWYASEQLKGSIREDVKSQLIIHSKTSSCPFLVKEECSIYPVRPLACRAFHIFGETCIENEDPWLTREEDMWTHSKDAALRASKKILPYWGIEDSKKQEIAFNSGFIMYNSKNMHEFDWSILYRNMLVFE